MINIELARRFVIRCLSDKRISNLEIDVALIEVFAERIMSLVGAVENLHAVGRWTLPWGTLSAKAQDNMWKALRDALDQLPLTKD